MFDLFECVGPWFCDCGKVMRWYVDYGYVCHWCEPDVVEDDASPCRTTAQADTV